MDVTRHFASENTKNRINNTCKNKNKETKKKNQSQKPSSSEPIKRVIRLIGGRIIDSENGKTCHQCRQKTMDFSVTCKNKDVDWRCPIHHYCHKCLLNRYGEKAEEVAALVDWKCPKCRGICNCSYCRKRRGCQPTGILVHAAKANGFSAVSDMLHAKDSKKGKTERSASSKKRNDSDEEPIAVLLKKQRKGNGVVDGMSDSKSKCRPFKNGGDCQKTEGSKMKKLRKNDLNVKNSKKSTEYACASVIKPTTSGKEPAAGSVRRTTRMNSSDRKSDLKSQHKPPTMKGSEKGTKNSKLRNLRKDNELDKALEGNRKRDASVEKIDNKKCKVSFRVPNEREKNCPRPTTHKKKATAKRKPADEFHKEKDSAVEVPLPQGIELTNLANIDMPAEDIGHALQLLEFCEAFGQVLGLKKGQSEMLLAELACGKSSHRKCDVSVVQLHIKLLSLIQQNSGKECGNLWLEDLKNCILESQCPSKEQFLDFLNVGPGGYEELNSSKKLRLLNFLCDEALGTLEIRSWIVKQNSEFVKEEKKAAREKVLVDKEKVKNMKKQLEGEVTAAILLRNGAPLSISEHENLVSKIKAEIAQTLAETLEGLDTRMKKEQRSDAVRSEPILLDANGCVFWKLRGYSGRTDILFQDVHKEDRITFKERWYTYDVHEKELVESYIYHHLRHPSK